MIRLGLLAAAALACAAAEAQPAREPSGALLKTDEIIRILPGRWEYRTEDGWDAEMAERLNCRTSAERIWFEKDARGNLIYHSKREAPDAKEAVSRVQIDKFLIFERPMIRVQYEGEQRLDENGKPIVWELFMTDKDTFYWHRVGWPPGATTAAVRRCRDAPVS